MDEELQRNSFTGYEYRDVKVKKQCSPCMPTVLQVLAGLQRALMKQWENCVCNRCGRDCIYGGFGFCGNCREYSIMCDFGNTGIHWMGNSISGVSERQ